VKVEHSSLKNKKSVAVYPFWKKGGERLRTVEKKEAGAYRGCLRFFLGVGSPLLKTFGKRRVKGMGGIRSHPQLIITERKHDGDKLVGPGKVRIHALRKAGGKPKPDTPVETRKRKILFFQKQCRPSNVRPTERGGGTYGTRHFFSRNVILLNRGGYEIGKRAWMVRGSPVEAIGALCLQGHCYQIEPH